VTAGVAGSIRTVMTGVGLTQAMRAAPMNDEPRYPAGRVICLAISRASWTIPWVRERAGRGADCPSSIERRILRSPRECHRAYGSILPHSVRAGYSRQMHRSTPAKSDIIPGKSGRGGRDWGGSWAYPCERMRSGVGTMSAVPCRNWSPGKSDNPQLMQADSLQESAPSNPREQD
jgi:hypothetical protein